MPAPADEYHEPAVCHVCGEPYIQHFGRIGTVPAAEIGIPPALHPRLSIPVWAAALHQPCPGREEDVHD